MDAPFTSSCHKEMLHTRVTITKQVIDNNKNNYGAETSAAQFFCTIASYQTPE